MAASAPPVATPPPPGPHSPSGPQGSPRTTSFRAGLPRPTPPPWPSRVATGVRYQRSPGILLTRVPAHPRPTDGAPRPPPPATRKLHNSNAHGNATPNHVSRRFPHRHTAEAYAAYQHLPPTPKNTTTHPAGRGLGRRTKNPPPIRTPQVILLRNDVYPQPLPQHDRLPALLTTKSARPSPGTYPRESNTPHKPIATPACAMHVSGRGMTRPDLQTTSGRMGTDGQVGFFRSATRPTPPPLSTPHPSAGPTSAERIADPTPTGPHQPTPLTAQIPAPASENKIHLAQLPAHHQPPDPPLPKPNYPLNRPPPPHKTPTPTPTAPRPPLAPLLSPTGPPDPGRPPAPRNPPPPTDTAKYLNHI